MKILQLTIRPSVTAKFAIELYVL